MSQTAEGVVRPRAKETSKITDFYAANEDGLAGWPKLQRQFVAGEKGRIETISLMPADTAPSSPILYFLVGWWGNASDYIPVMRYFAQLGLASRCFSWRGTGQSEGNSFWGRGYEDDLIRVIRHFDDPHIALIPHSGAADYVRNALPTLSEHRGIDSIIFVAPLARSGAMMALLRWLQPDTSGTNILRWLRFLGSNIWGLAWFMRHEIGLRRVLLSDTVSYDIVDRVRRQIDDCPWGRYCLSLLRHPKFLRPKRINPADFGIPHSLVLHCALDRNFSEEQQQDTAEGFTADFETLPNACHQWFADPYTFALASDRILNFLKIPQPQSLSLPLAV